MADGLVYVIDRVLTRPGAARQFVDAYLTGYAPGARDRGMTLCSVQLSPPVWFDDRPNTVIATWSLPSARAWWEMTWKGRPDPSIGQWWDEIDDLVLERSRSVAADAVDVDRLCDV